mgnify:CR=1 FL=1
MRNISNIKGVLYAVVSSATFGLIPLFSIPLLHAGMASPTILFYRMLLSAAIMAAVALLLKRNFRISRRDFGVLAGLSLMYAATSLGLLRSYDYIPSGVATTVNFLYPLVVTIVMTLFFRERSSVWIVIAVFISLVGVALLAWGDAGNNDPGRGLIYAGTTVFTYAVYIIGVMKSRAGRLDPLIVAFYVLTFSAAVFLVYALSTSGIAVVHTWHIWRNLLLLALLPTVLSNLTLVLAIKHIGSTMTSILGSMEPLTAVLVGVVHFGEGFDLDSAAGLILVVTAVIIVILQTNHTPQTPPANIPPTQPKIAAAARSIPRRRATLCPQAIRRVAPTAVQDRLGGRQAQRPDYFFFRFGLAGNHPFATRPRCSNSSPIDQSDDAPQTASRVDQRICRTATDAAIAATPISRKNHQQRTPK